MRRGPGIAWRWVVWLQVAALAFIGAVTVARFHIWAAIDEEPHYAYIQSIAEDGRLPRLTDPVSWQATALANNTYPRPSPVPATGNPLVGVSYEAFQPPLYYLAAAPAFLSVSDYRDKVLVVRAFDLLLVLAATCLLFVLARAALPEAPLIALAGGILVLLWPGVLVRGVTIGNPPLELVLTTAYLVALARATRSQRRRDVVLAGALLGLCLLTKLTLVYLLLPLLVVLVRLGPRSWRAAAGALLAPAIVLSPWLISNVVRYGSPTLNSAARAQQAPVLYPGGNRFDVGDLPAAFARLVDGVLPQEFGAQLDVPWVRAATLVLFAMLVIGAVVAWRPRTGRLATLSLVAGLVVAIATMLVANWDIFLLRYFYPVLPAIGVAAAATLWRRAPRLAAWSSGVQMALVLALWADMVGAFYFTDLGHSLGI